MDQVQGEPEQSKWEGWLGRPNVAKYIGNGRNRHASRPLGGSTPAPNRPLAATQHGPIGQEPAGQTVLDLTDEATPTSTGKERSAQEVSPRREIPKARFGTYGRKDTESAAPSESAALSESAMRIDSAMLNGKPIDSTDDDSDDLRSSSAAPHSDGSTVLRRSSSNVKRRIVTGAAFGALVGISLWLGPYTALVLILLVLVGATGEWFAVLRHGGYRPATVLGLAGTAVAVTGGFLGGTRYLPLIAVGFILASMLWFLGTAGRTATTANLAVTLLGFAWVGMMGSFAGALLDPTRFPHRHGVAYLMGALVTTVAYDTGAYAVGARFGRQALAPSISPNKTKEGLVGGTISALVVAMVVVASVAPWTLWLAVCLALLVSLAAPVGDLVESMLKRDVGVKDMGSLLPGHGGLLDRIDGMLFVLPATYLLLVIAHAR